MDEWDDDGELVWEEEWEAGRVWWDQYDMIVPLAQVVNDPLEEIDPFEDLTGLPA